MPRPFVPELDALSALRHVLSNLNKALADYGMARAEYADYLIKNGAFSSGTDAGENSLKTLRDRMLSAKDALLSAHKNYKTAMRNLIRSAHL